ncbi:hypothetical protein [Actinoplanes aureus]|uniref:Uncharacterized protein n=1 Tax=Actinoplanes aureus TaxID=2792083 RepID=A0A931G132_9ACTN|nr:hypothetical protein [Actinoplanes aureus]MBG0561974.1 hypothetical protein [Actinoplanes aureus]
MRIHRPTLLSLVLLLLITGVVVRLGDRLAEPDAVPVAATVTDDAGDELATTTYDGPMIRRRAAIAIHPVAGADRAAIARELRAVAAREEVGELTDSTFAVFSAEMLEYLVPELTLVMPEGVSVHRAEAFMRDFRPASVGFYLVETVLVHDLTFAVLPVAGVAPATVRDRIDAEGVLADSLNRYETTVQPAGVTVRYFGAVLSDGQIARVRASIGRAAGVPAERVLVEASRPGAGVDLSHGVPNLVEPPHGH